MAISKFSSTGTDKDGSSLKDIAATVQCVRRFIVRGGSNCTAQLVLRSISGSGSYSVWYLKVSLDGITYFDPIDSTTGIAAPVAMTMTASGVLSKTVDISGPLFVEIGQTTLSTYTTEVVDMTFSQSDWA